MIRQLIVSIILLWATSLIAQEAPQVAQPQTSAPIAFEGQVINAKGGRIQVHLKNGEVLWFSVDSSKIPSGVIGKVIKGEYVPLGDTSLVLNPSFLNP